MSRPELVEMPLGRLLTFWRPGSHDWTWANEHADLIGDPRTAAVAERVDAEGFGFIDYVAPVLLGNDGRVWDGHHRIVLAIERGVASLMVDVVAPSGVDPSAEPAPEPPRTGYCPRCAALIDETDLS